MKKYMILITVLSLSLAVCAQRPERNAPTRNTTEKKKSESTTPRTRTNESKSRSTENARSGRSEKPAATRTQNSSTSRQERPTVTRTESTRSSQPERPTVNRTETRTRTEPANRSERNTETTVRTRPPSTDPGRDRNNEATRNADRSPTLTRTDRNPGEANRRPTVTRTERHPGEASRYPEARRSNPNVTDRKYEAERRDYRTPNRRVERHPATFHSTRPRPVEYRRVHYVYREPRRVHVIWTRRMYRDYCIMYPEYHYWYYPIGYRISTISAYDAGYHIGEVRNVYGKVFDTWYAPETDEYFLYFGAGYPYQDFTVIVPGIKARRFSQRPEIFFRGRYIWVTGLISVYEGKPEMVIKRTGQINLY